MYFMISYVDEWDNSSTIIYLTQIVKIFLIYIKWGFKFT